MKLAVKLFAVIGLLWAALSAYIVSPQFKTDPAVKKMTDSVWWLEGLLSAHSISTDKDPDLKVPRAVAKDVVSLWFHHDILLMALSRVQAWSSALILALSVVLFFTANRPGKRKPD